MAEGKGADISLRIVSGGDLAAESEAVKRQFDLLAAASGKVQGQRVPLSSVARCAEEHAQDTLVFAEQGSVLLGYIRGGTRSLFVYANTPKPAKKSICSVMDFFVAEAARRQGMGILLLRRLGRELRTAPAAMAFDRPSPLMRGFLAKHFAAKRLHEEPNNFAFVSVEAAAAAGTPAA